MRYQYNDGGRASARFKGKTGDCVVRAIAIATGKPYRDVYHELSEGIESFAEFGRSSTAKMLRFGRSFDKKAYTPRNGVHRQVYEPYLKRLGWRWVPTMKIGQGCRVHLKDGELPTGRLIVCVSKHMVAVIDGVAHDTFDPTRNGTRCVYGYWQEPLANPGSAA